ncbi:hypothetical protein [Duganella sp. Root1480D1]|uniref:hypothetical protein n=1 Tax=Duganella sp. Root1480D1 TaxID=1736471 RepID=UPI00070E23D8|nr:hypothetical protein [Duganella sp. Root1480D1]KQZ30737.1 hypothetical protein ASD58_30140 [Duganella sp. Root1480D1]
MTLEASNDLNITSVSEFHLSDIEIDRKSGHGIKKSSSDATDYNATTLAIGSNIKGGTFVAANGTVANAHAEIGVYSEHSMLVRQKAKT